MAYRNDILICGLPVNFHNKQGLENSTTHFYAFQGFDFMAAFGLNPGDVVGIKQGPNGESFLDHIDFGLATLNGITFINDPSNTKQIEIGWFGLGNNCQNVKFLGNGNSLKYGFKLTHKDHPGLSWGCVGDLEIGFFEVDGANMGVQVVNVAGITYPVNYQRLFAHDLLIQRTVQEAMYLGHVHDSPIAAELKVDNVTIIDAGWDGIQTRNTKSVLITNCTINGTGKSLHEGDEHGILFGANSNGGTVKNCKLSNIAGIGIWQGGWGDFEYSCNEIQAQTMGIMSRSSYPESDLQNTGRQSQLIKNNKIDSPKSIECYYTETGKKISVDAENNMVTGTINIDPNITTTNVNNGPNVVPDCGSAPVPPQPAKELFHRGYFSLTSGKRFFYIMYSDNTWVETDGRYRPK